MIKVLSFEKFCSILSDFESDGIKCKLYGSSYEKFIGMQSISENKPNNTFIIHIVALTSIGTIYCHHEIKLTDTVTVEKAKSLYESLNIIQAKLTMKNDIITIT